MRKVDPVKHDEKRAGILAAAGRCFARDGFHGATIAHICAEANISPGHLYHYFETKDSIVAAMCSGVEYANARFVEASKAPNPISAMVSEIDRLYDGALAEPGIWLDILAEAGRNRTVADSLRANSSDLRDLLSDFLRHGQSSGKIDPTLDADMSAAILISLMDGFVALSVRAPNLDHALRSKTLDQLVKRFLSPPV